MMHEKNQLYTFAHISFQRHASESGEVERDNINNNRLEVLHFDLNHENGPKIS